MAQRAACWITTSRWIAAACLTVAPFGESRSSPPDLESLAREGAPIAIVRVECVHDVEQSGKPIDGHAWPEKTIRVAECAVERMLLGDPQVARMSICVRGDGRAGERPTLAVGARALVFVDCDSARFWRTRASAQTLQRLEKLAGQGGPRIALADGVWPIEGTGAEATVRVPSDVAALPEALTRDRSARSLPLEAVLAWSSAEIRRVAPSLSVTVVTNGPKPWSIELEADGTWHGTETGALSADELQHLWATLRTEQLFDLPDQVGFSPSPDSPWFRIRASSPGEARQIDVYPGSANRIEDPELRASMERALRIWAAIPGRSKPTFRG